MTTFNVSSATELKAALSGAVGGDRIVLADGNYGKVYVTNRAFASAVTIEAATPGTGAHLDGLFVAGTKNLNVVGLDIGRALNAGEPTYTQLSSISNSTNIKLSGVTIHGSLDGNPGNDGAGLTVTGVTGFSVSGSHFEELYRGIVLQKSTNSAIHDNEITMMRSDGIISVANDGLSIEGNHIGEFRPAIGDHADAIQFWNTGQTRGQSNITIKDNVIYQSFTSDVAGTGMQGIFISDPLTYGYKNVLIQNNLLYCNDLYNGIFLNGASGAQIIDNTVVSKANDGKNFWINLMNSDHVSLVHNISDKIIVASNVTDFTQDGNVNLTTDAAARALLNLTNPTGVGDLITADSGYQLPTSAPMAPVSSALGNAIGSMLSGSSVSHAVAGDLTVHNPATATGLPVLDTGAAKAALVSAQPVVEDTHFAAMPHFAPSPAPSSHWYFEHYIALP
jgi:hypothetical protein